MPAEALVPVWLVEFLVAAAYGVVGAVVPVFNAEAYAIAAGALHPAGSAFAILGVTLGQSIGKMLMFWGVRRGKELRFFHAGPATGGAVETPPRAEAELGTVRRWWSRTVRVSLRLVGDTRWGLPLIFLASLVGFPPLYPVVLVAGASPIPAASFALTMTVARGLRFALLAWGGTGLVALLA
ncbi:hypothetical protein GA0111570_10549 [Raineyella antarctica]|uniref:Membrane protein YqaA, SNARE-associated domain n=1 Tax=Raineyella antarctica TaxID=1577474 RepID=A0A1G6GTL8_9ACTN|nr:hypothetical protein [Raineyella antarctica]SDB85370.1 hypothetical protein GA0111570_10549 [Raineyella antarctica]